MIPTNSAQKPVFSNRRTPPTDADFEVPPGILPGRRLPDWCYMDDDVAPPPEPEDEFDA